MLKRTIIACLLCLLPLLGLAQEAKLLPPTTDEIKAAQKQGRYLATLTLENGKTVEIVLEGAYMPMTVANFVKLAKAHYFDGMDFSTVISQKLPDGTQMGLVSGGDPSGAGPGYRLPLEISPFLADTKRGAVGMVNLMPSGSQEEAAGQFIIARSDLPGLFNIFGWVKSDMAVVDEIQKGDLVKTVTVAQYAGNEECPVLTVMPKPAAYRPPTKADVDAARKQGRYLATINMESGKKIVLVLEGKQMPITVANFVKLVQTKYFDGLVFHRVVKDPGMQLIQGGDPEGTGRGGPGYQIRYERGNLINKSGALGMARSQALNSAGSQFYILNSDVPDFDRGMYAIFGWVKEGQDVVKDVKIGDRMKSVTVVPYPGTEPCPVQGSEQDAKDK